MRSFCAAPQSCTFIRSWTQRPLKATNLIHQLQTFFVRQSQRFFCADLKLKIYNEKNVSIFKRKLTKIPHICVCLPIIVVSPSEVRCHWSSRAVFPRNGLYRADDLRRLGLAKKRLPHSDNCRRLAAKSLAFLPTYIPDRKPPIIPNIQNMKKNRKFHTTSTKYIPGWFYSRCAGRLRASIGSTC